MSSVIFIGKSDLMDLFLFNAGPARKYGDVRAATFRLFLGALTLRLEGGGDFHFIETIYVIHIYLNSHIDAIKFQNICTQ